MIQNQIVIPSNVSMSPYRRKPPTMKRAVGMIGYTSPAKAIINMAIAIIQPITSKKPSPYSNDYALFPRIASAIFTAWSPTRSKLETISTNTIPDCAVQRPSLSLKI